MNGNLLKLLKQQTINIATLSNSGSRSSNSYYSSKGKYNIEGNKVVLNFGGSDRILIISDDNNVLTDAEGNK
jgi:hypothetical protein